MRKHTKRTVRDPMACITRRMPLATDQTQDLGLSYHAALGTMMTEYANESAWSVLACSLNIALLLAEQGINPDAEPVIKLAQEALMQVRRHALAGNGWRINLSHHLKQAIMAAVCAHDEQCAQCTKGQISAALREINRRIEMDEVLA